MENLSISSYKGMVGSLSVLVVRSINVSTGCKFVLCWVPCILVYVYFC